MLTFGQRENGTLTSFSWLRRLVGKPAADFAQPTPEVPIHVIGDIHGCLPLLKTLTDQLNPDHLTVCVGDYLDRGDDSAGVLRWLQGRANTICLRGNHEDMMLGFLDAPERKGPRWLKFGGLQTLASFGISGVSETSDPAALISARDALSAAMGPTLEEWLRGLPTRYVSGNVAIVHAGADPELPIAMQSDKTLMWGHKAFDTKTRTDGTWVVFGHTITPEPSVKNGRIGIDTGAYATGRLTAVRFDPAGTYDFVST